MRVANRVRRCLIDVLQRRDDFPAASTTEVAAAILDALAGLEAR
jgi:hypothetical protein